METPEENGGKGVGDPGGGKSVTPQKKTRPTTLLEDTGRASSPGPTRLKDRVSFYEQVWSGAKSPSTETVAEKGRSNVDDRSLFADVRASTEDSSSNNSESFEETFERVVEEGDLLGGGAKVVKFERITVHKSVREITTVRPTTPISGAAPSEATVSRTPSEERILQDDSAYHTVSHSQPSTNGYHTSASKSSSVTSLAGRFPSEESLRRTPSREGLQQVGATELEGGSRPGSTSSSIEWYSEYRTQSFHNMAAKLEYIRSRSQYDSHIAEIKGI
ncbi:hypothetical protein B7P43_G00878 [Cryptotermes secundus]|uniref:Uncharacterized protein n=1 Tax=Cryptotermes secundus TaxID=105785 RepID=A0A2J7PK65_9NEOP|nr:hypothetical protein B7P43_G00878 [Cryptotermes secundus]